MEKKKEILANAFKAIDRKDFVLPHCKEFAYVDAPLSIGYQQTISQPSTVCFMLDWLAVKKGHQVLDIGSGSGWTTALLAYLVGPKGKVIGVERIQELVAFGKTNLAKYGFPHAKIIQAEGELGHVGGGPYDRILVSAAANELPRRLLMQLILGGIMVIPIGSAIWKMRKNKAGYTITKKEGFRFVPLRRN